MTYKRADRPGWPRLRAQRFVCQRLTDASVEGYISLLRMVEVAEPLWVLHGEQRVCIADAGYSWLQIFPAGAHYTHTTMFDADDNAIQEYIDLVAEQGVDEQGVPWYDDLYLDLTWIPEGSPLLLDQEELEAAHAIGAITPEQYELARGETARLLVALTMGDYTLPELARAWYPRLLAALDEAGTMLPESATEPIAVTPPEATAAPDPAETPSANGANAARHDGEQSVSEQRVEDAEQAEHAEHAASREDGEQHA